MSEESIPNLRRSIEAMKTKQKKLQDTYTEEGEHLRYYEEKEMQIQEFIRELNNKNKELQKQIDARQAEQMTKNSLYDKQHQETIEKLYTQHQRLLEKKSDLLAKEKKGPLELQQLEEKYSKLLREKQEILVRQQQILQQEEKNYREANDKQTFIINKIMNLQSIREDFDDSSENEEEEDVLASKYTSESDDNDEDLDDFDFNSKPILSLSSSKKNPLLMPGGIDFNNDLSLKNIINELNDPKERNKDFGFPGLSDFQFKTFMDIDEEDDSYADDDDNFISTNIDFPAHMQASKGTQSSLINSQIPTSFIQGMPNFILGSNNSYNNNDNQTLESNQENSQTNKLIECFKQQLALKEKLTTLTVQINALESFKTSFESEIAKLTEEQNQQKTSSQQETQPN